MFAARATEPAVGCRSSSRCLGGTCVLTTRGAHQPQVSFAIPSSPSGRIQPTSWLHSGLCLLFWDSSATMFFHLHEAQARIALEQQRKNRHAVQAAVSNEEAGLAQEGWRLQHLVPAHPQRGISSEHSGDGAVGGGARVVYTPFFMLVEPWSSLVHTI